MILLQLTTFDLVQYVPEETLGKSLLFLHASPTCKGFKARIKGHFTVGHLDPDVGVEMKLGMTV